MYILHNVIINPYANLSNWSRQEPQFLSQSFFLNRFRATIQKFLFIFNLRDPLLSIKQLPHLFVFSFVIDLDIKKQKKENLAEDSQSKQSKKWETIQQLGYSLFLTFTSNLLSLYIRKLTKRNKWKWYQINPRLGI